MIYALKAIAADGKIIISPIHLQYISNSAPIQLQFNSNSAPIIGIRVKLELNWSKTEKKLELNISRIMAEMTKDMYGAIVRTLLDIIGFH